MIDSFQGDYRWLSNFWEEPFDCKGVLVPTAEHAFQALKTPDRQARAEILAADSPAAAKALGRRAPLFPNWDEVKVPIMRSILACKFPYGSQLAWKLIGTGEQELVEGNTWGDKFWGCVREPNRADGIWVGANHLGILLMERRAQLNVEVKVMCDA